MFGASKQKKALIEAKEKQLQSKAEALSERLSAEGFILEFNVSVLCRVRGKPLGIVDGIVESIFDRSSKEVLESYTASVGSITASGYPLDPVPGHEASTAGVPLIDDGDSRSYHYAKYIIRVQKYGTFRRGKSGFLVILEDTCPLEFEAQLTYDGVELARLTKKFELEGTAIHLEEDDDLTRSYDIELIPTTLQAHSMHKTLKSVQNYRRGPSRLNGAPPAIGWDSCSVRRRSFRIPQIVDGKAFSPTYALQ